MRRTSRRWLSSHFWLEPATKASNQRILLEGVGTSSMEVIHCSARLFPGGMIWLHGIHYWMVVSQPTACW